MIRIAREEDFLRLEEIWVSAVKATHHFISEKDYELYKNSLIPVYFQNVSLYVFVDESGLITGFTGISDDKIEMLFVHDLYRGKGIGRKLLEFGINKCGCDKVDVNEQNLPAIRFYSKYGFAVRNRSETDAYGKPYPILYMDRK